MKRKVSVFFPVYNEAWRLEANVLSVRRFLQDSRMDYELIVIDDGSTDSTQEIAKVLQKEMGVIYIRYKKGCSRRENLARSFEKAGGDIIAFMDADLATDIGQLPELVKEADMHGIAIGCRYAKGSVIKRKPSRLLFSIAYNSFMRLYFGSRVRDHQCGFKAFRRDILLDLAKEAGYDRSLRRGWFWDAEILIRAQKKGHRIKEIPVVWRDMRKSSFNIRREIKMIPYILRLKFYI